MLRSADHPLIKKVAERTKVCEGSVYENIKLVGLQKDRAIFLSNLFCMATASDLGKDGGALYPKTGGCFKTHEVRVGSYTMKFGM